MTTLAIIPAGGTGRRMAKGVAKQYLPLAGTPVLLHTLRAFQDSPAIDEILLAVPGVDIPEVRETIVAGQGLTKLSRIVAGGAERQDSVRNALACARPEHGIVLIHDGVRPFVSGELIGRVVTAAREYGASTAGVPVKETVKEVDAGGWITRTIPREGLWLTQTPQAFRLDVIRAAYAGAERDAFCGTDDASLVERLGIPVRMVTGEYGNIKLTTPEDLILGEVLIRRCGQRSDGG